MDSEKIIHIVPHDTSLCGLKNVKGNGLGMFSSCKECDKIAQKIINNTPK